MRRLYAIVAIAVVTLAGCVSAPPEKAPEPRRKERQETIHTPIVVKETSYFANGALDRTISYTYDASLKLLLERVVWEPSRSDPTEKTVYEYADGSLSMVTVLDYDGKIKSRTTYETDAKGQVLREVVTDAKGIPQTSSRYEYDPAGLRTKRSVYDGADVLLAVSKYSYASGRLSIVMMKDAAERPAGRIEHEYDTEGRLTVRTTFDPSGVISQRERFIYKEGALVEEKTERGDGRVERRTVYEIGPDGAPVKSTLYDGSGHVRDIRTYEYVIRTEERTVVYYE